MWRRFPFTLLGVIAAGGAVGTELRALLARAMPPGIHGFPWSTLIVNLVGGFVLGFVVLVALERTAPSRFLRPLVGTGFCGGLTTFSTLVMQIDLLVKAGRLGTAALYLVTSTAGGMALAWLGVATARAAWSIKEEN